ncbi:DUF3530 family protein [Bacterioplanes sanyensis]|nr:DUF3530 family protein [Bacterioplanes sanyensis]
MPSYRSQFNLLLASLLLPLSITVLTPTVHAEEDTATAAENSADTESGDAAEDTSGNSAEETADDSNAASNAEPPPRALPDTHLKRHQDILEHMVRLGREHEVVTLVANSQPFSGLYLPESSGRPQGGILLLHDRGQHGHWPALIAPLREYLPAYGWATLAIELPLPPATPPPPRSDSMQAVTDETPEEANADNTAADSVPDNAAADADNDTQREPVDSNGISLQGDVDSSDLSDNEPGLPPLERLPELAPAAEPAPLADTAAVDAADEYRQRVRERIEAAVTYLKQRGQYNLVILTNGISASWAADYMLASPIDSEAGDTAAESSRAREPGHTLVLIDPLDDPYSQVPLIDQVSQLEIRVLDLLTDLRPRLDYQDARRAGAMRRRQRDLYQQIELPARASVEPGNSLILRRVRGWLRTHAAGMEVGQSASQS